MDNAESWRPITPEERPYLDAAGGRLRAWRQASGVSVCVLARNARVAPPTVSRIERGLRRPRRSMLVRLVAVLDLLAGERGGGAARARELVELLGSALAPESAYPKHERRARGGP